MESAYVLKRILKPYLVYSSYLAGSELFQVLANYVSDHDGGSFGFLFTGVLNGGWSGKTLLDDIYYYTDEYLHPWDFISEMQRIYQFDYEIRPNFCQCGWRKMGKIIPGYFYQDQDFLLRSLAFSGLDVASVVRARSRGGNTAWLYDAVDSTATSNYGFLANFLDVVGKSEGEVQAAAERELALLSSPAVLVEVEPNAPTWFGRCVDLGDTVTLHLTSLGDMDLPCRVYGLRVRVDERGEKLDVDLQSSSG
jgi:hypothetical protein